MTDLDTVTCIKIKCTIILNYGALIYKYFFLAKKLLIYKPFRQRSLFYHLKLYSAYYKSTYAHTCIDSDIRAKEGSITFIGSPPATDQAIYSSTLSAMPYKLTLCTASERCGQCCYFRTQRLGHIGIVY